MLGLVASQLHGILMATMGVLYNASASRDSINLRAEI